MTIDHKFFNETKSKILDKDLNLETEEQQKRFIQNKVFIDPFRTNPSGVHYQIHEQSQGTISNIITIEKTREVLNAARNKMLFPRVDIENIRYFKNVRGNPFAKK